MPKRSEIVQGGVFTGLPESLVSQIGEASHLSTEEGFADCWPWKGNVMGGTGTGLLAYGRAKTWTSGERLVHRIVYEWKNGAIPKGQQVQHLCNIPPCCNPAHLTLGTHQENMQHMVSCKRSADVSGVKNPKRILEPAQVLEIRVANAAGETAKSIACRMKLELGTVNAVVLRDRNHGSRFRHWQEVGGPMRSSDFKRKPHDKFGQHAEAIRLEYEKGAMVNEIAKQWNATPAQIANILRGKSHADRPGPIFCPRLHWGKKRRGRPTKGLASVARAIRVDYANDGTVNALAENYEVCDKSITKILLGQSYPHEGGPIASMPLRYSDLTIRLPRKEPRFVVRTQGLVLQGQFAGLPHSIVRKIGDPVDREDAMGYLGCWPWKGYKKSGYGAGRKYAHVRLYEWSNGRVPPGLEVMHQCHQKDCCNPAHLRAGTHSENMQSMATAGRASCLTGTNNPASRFTDAEVLDIRTRYASGVALSSIAAEKGLNSNNLNHLLRYDSKKASYRFWREVGGPFRSPKINT